MRLGLQEITGFLGLPLVVQAAQPRRLVTQAGWDSRTLQEGGIFIALEGERVDGHAYIANALRAGAALVVSARPFAPAEVELARQMGAALLQCPDPQFAFGEIARLWRGHLSCQVIGVTGSNGKTSTKELIASVLTPAFEVSISQGNYNNLLGLPASLLDAPLTTQRLILEMGMQYSGEIRRYCQIAQPDCAVITNIGLAHLELLGSQEAIARAKAEIIEGLPDQTGQLVLNGDDAWADRLLDFGRAGQRSLQVWRYGVQDSNDVTASELRFDDDGHPLFLISFPDGRATEVGLQLQGRHSVLNALAAASVGFIQGLTPAEIKQGLEEAPPMSMRQEVVELSSGARLIDDSYNANPGSMQAALDTLATIQDGRPHIAVLGDMLELGPTADELHFEVGQAAAAAGLDLLLTVGPHARQIAAGAATAGLEPDRIISTDNKAAALQALAPYLAERPLVLIKASRALALDTIVCELKTEGHGHEARQ